MPVKKIRSAVLALSAFVLVYASPSQANFHLWDISEIYSNADGSVQYVELFTSSDGQQVLNDHTIVASRGAEMHTFTFTFNSGTPTGNKHLLIGTAGLSTAPGGVTPDYIMDDGFLFTPDGTVNFGENASVQTYATLPTDGVMSLHYPGGTAQANSPTNFAGEVGNLTGGAGPTPTPTNTVEATSIPTPEPTSTLTNTPEATATNTTEPVATETPTATTQAEATSTRSADFDGVDGVDPKDLFAFILYWMLENPTSK